MKIGVHLANGRPFASAESIVPLGVRAEELGFDSLWVSDHVAIPSVLDDSKYPYGPPGTFNPDVQQNYWEAFAVLAFMAGKTSRIELGTSVIVVPQRPPLLIAKQWATLDALCGGRTILGIGAGWCREEFEALGMGDYFPKRGPATDEAVRIFRAAWSADREISADGEVYRFAPVRIFPKPARRGGPPIWVGGHGRRSIRRAAELGDGWHAVRIRLDELRAGIATLHEMLGRYGRQPSDVVVSNVVIGWLPGSGPQGQPNDWDMAGSAEQIAERMRAYQQAGVEHLVINASSYDSHARMHETIDFFGREVKPLLGS